jgi:hypothetical protein
MTNQLVDKIHAKRAPDQEDRFTLILTCHYQEWENPTTTAKWAYDRTLPSENIPYQRSVKVSPSSDPEKRTEIKIGDLEFGKCEIAFGHNPIAMSKDLSPKDPNAAILQEMQASNTIKITNSKGDLVVEIGSGRCAFGQYPGPLYAQSTKATAFLSVTAFPL